jgi:hypothetical protein
MPMSLCAYRFYLLRACKSGVITVVFENLGRFLWSLSSSTELLYTLAICSLYLTALDEKCRIAALFCSHYSQTLRATGGDVVHLANKIATAAHHFAFM